MFEKILIANRGEIAIRVARACKEMGITSVAVYSEADRDAPHVKACDEAFLIGPAVPSESYLSIEKIIQACRDSGAEAVHPGYGFLAENADFARALDEAGINFIGPPATAIDAMGSKTMAREVMEKAGVPIVPGATEPAKDLEEAKAQAEAAGYPVACKAVGGGGGKGFRVAMTADELQEAFEGSAREGEKFFSDDRVYVERYLEDPRHVEVQVLADKHGNVIHLGERDCSIQRRHQKVIEEAPGPHVDEEMRERIGKIATDAARARRQPRLDSVQPERGVLGDLRAHRGAQPGAEAAWRGNRQSGGIRQREQGRHGATAWRRQPANVANRPRKRCDPRRRRRAVVRPRIEPDGLRDEGNAEPGGQRAVERVFVDCAVGEDGRAERSAGPASLRRGMRYRQRGETDLGERAGFQRCRAARLFGVRFRRDRTRGDDISQNAIRNTIDAINHKIYRRKHADVREIRPRKRTCL